MANRWHINIDITWALRAQRWIVSYWRGTEGTYLDPRHSSYSAKVNFASQNLEG